ncbi:hypothetical protein BN7_1249 [Wickerhamomyces ciferrii]|uniref:Uncharacterized protein n=1 Tax=Wickerhamomyces ciferrii (strain ATCC 14091 / BCRC 22168 / CBS 111 / JCM 3599 / NBRC 0793 / NRRL Y-1031 F-60-10) TaxID=1206466 RepID=K0KKR1_WICCF|nr:uncharacterized protein BN7_1249 [Wickerhamomyces ciferrii]CCH41708.1 hypothetical protein BN7_1249 [Wickerhamomyces ciferrii]
MELSQLIIETRKFLGLSQFKEALKLLKKYKSQFNESCEFLQIFGETYLENGKVEKAYEFLEKSCSMDLEGHYGSEKFFYLGQIIGGSKGIEFIDHGINQLTTKLQQNEESSEITKKQLIKKLNQGLFAEIEIWMTDLCMEPEAETKCNELINQSLTIDDSNPESWSLLASIRISQQRDQEASEAITKAWDLFESKKTGLEDNNNINTGELDSEDLSNEYVELIQPLITLARFSIELGLYELGGVIASNVRDIDEDNVESLYLEGFANYLIVKKHQYDSKFPNYDADQFDGFIINSGDVKFNENLKQVKLNLEQVLKISNQFDVDEDIINHSQFLISEIGDFKIDDDLDINIDENNWEDKINSDEE